MQFQLVIRFPLLPIYPIKLLIGVLITHLYAIQLLPIHPRKLLIGVLIAHLYAIQQGKAFFNEPSLERNTTTPLQHLSTHFAFDLLHRDLKGFKIDIKSTFSMDSATMLNLDVFLLAKLLSSLMVWPNNSSNVVLTKKYVVMAKEHLVG